MSGKKIEFVLHYETAPSSSQGIFGVTDADGYRFDVYITGGDLRVFNKDSGAGKSGYYDITPTTAFVTGNNYHIEVTYGLDGQSPTNVKIDGVMQTVPAKTSEIPLSATTSAFYCQTIGAGVGTPTFAGDNGISELKVYDTDETTLLAYWKLNTLGEGLEDQVGSDDFAVTGAYGRYDKESYEAARDAIQTTAANQPTTVEDGALVTLNGKPALDFDGSASYLRIAHDSFPAPTTALQVVVVVQNSKATVSGNNEYIISQYESGSNERSWALLISASGDEIRASFGAANGSFGGSRVADSIYTLNEVQIIGFKYDAGTVTLYRNGAEIASSRSGTIPASLFDTTADVTIGCALSSNAPVVPWDGQIGDVYIANNLDDDIIEIMDNMNTYYGIY